MKRASPRRVPLAGSERHALAGAHEVGPSDSSERFEVSVHLRPRTPLPSLAEHGAATRRMSRAQFAAAHGASEEDVARVSAFADAHGLRVDAVHPGRRTVVLSGTARALGDAFDVRLQRWERDGVGFRGRTGAVHVPVELAAVVDGVFGLDDRPQARSRVARRAVRAPQGRAFTPPEIASLYGFPRDADCRGQTVALLQLGGGYRPSDLHRYFSALRCGMPRITDVDVDHGINAWTGDPSSDDSEVQLDVEVLGALAPGVRIALYFAPNTERGFLDGVSAAIHDERLRPSVLSISWGAAEPTWTLQALRAIDSAFAAAAALGVTVCAAAGDSGSGDDVHDRRPHVDFPASSPGALACGGTRLHLHRDGSLASEEVWHDGGEGGSTGGGVSAVFDVPPWQRRCEGGGPPSSGEHRGRGVPDVAAAADPATGYALSVDGTPQVLGGTSAAAPLWAALVAIANARRGSPVGLLAPLLYAAAEGGSTPLLRDVTRGGNGAYRARPGWDPCTGLGTPRAGELIAALCGRWPLA